MLGNRDNYDLDIFTMAERKGLKMGSRMEMLI